MNRVGQFFLPALLLTSLVLLSACNLPLNPTRVTPAASTSTPDLSPIATMTASAIQTGVASVPTPAVRTATPDSADPTPETPDPGAPPGGSGTTAWLLYNTTGGLVVSGANGENPRSLGVFLPEGQPELLPGPAGGWVAFRTVSSQAYPPLDVSLALLQLPGEQVQIITPLLSEAVRSEAADAAAAGDSLPEAVSSVTLPDALAWSPDGTRLAFTAALDGPSSDLYVYNLISGQITQLTDGPTEAATPLWSPDGNWIVHQGVAGFGTGAGWEVEGVWAAAADGSGNRSLFEPADGNPQSFAGWTSSDTFLVYSWTPNGANNLRTVSLSTGQATPVFEPVFDEAALDPQTGAIAIAVSRFSEAAGSDPGVYLYPSVGVPERVYEGSFTHIDWDSQARRFVARGDEGALLLTLQGGAVFYPLETWGTVAPDASHAAFWADDRWDPRPGLRIYSVDGDLKREITAESVYRALWQPGSHGLFYIVESRLYLVAPLDAHPQLVSENVLAGALNGITWVLP